MELWIRSQDRTILRKVDTIGIVEGRDFWSIDENLTVSFGKYKTKERALEVLNEIQNKINLINLGHDFGSPMIDLKIQHIFIKCQKIRRNYKRYKYKL